MGKPKVIELPNIPAEYHYIQRLGCDNCGKGVIGDRKGSRPGDDGKRMHDIWDIKCPHCGAAKQIILSVPTLDVLSMLNLDKKK